jgi:FMN reductase
MHQKSGILSMKKSDSIKILVINSNLHEHSNTSVLAKHACAYLKNSGTVFEFLDLTSIDLPVCDGDKVFKRKDVIELERKIAQFQGIIITTPVYNFNVNAALKNLIELTGHGWIDKVVGFICTAGGLRSYMSVQSFASSMMLDFRSLIVPRFVFAKNDDFLEGKLQNEQIRERIDRLAETVTRLARAWTDIKL